MQSIFFQTIMPYNSQFTIHGSFPQDSNEIAQAIESKAPNSPTGYFKFIYHSTHNFLGK